MSLTRWSRRTFSSVTNPSAVSAVSSPPSTSESFVFQWADVPKSVFIPHAIELHRPPVSPIPKSTVRVKKYKYDLNEFIAVTKLAKKCETPEQLEAMVKVTPFRCFNAFNIADVFKRFHTFVPKLNVVGKRLVESEDKHVQPSFYCVQHMYVPLMEMDFTPKAFACFTSTCVTVERAIPPFVLYKLRWSKMKEFDPLSFVQTLYSLSLNKKELAEPMLTEQIRLEKEIYANAMRVVQDKIQARTFWDDFRNRGLLELVASFQKHYDQEKEWAYSGHVDTPELNVLIRECQAIFTVRSLHDVNNQDLVKMCILPLMSRPDLATGFEARMKKEIKLRGLNTFTREELSQMSQAFHSHNQDFSSELEAAGLNTSAA